MPAYQKFVGTKSFWREYESLSAEKRKAADATFARFKKDPFAEAGGKEGGEREERKSHGSPEYPNGIAS
jgi:hypothetical protein